MVPFEWSDGKKGAKMALTARVRNGHFVLDETPTELPEGTRVTLELVDLDDLDDEERERLNACLDEGLAESEAGTLIPQDEAFARLGWKR